MKAKKQLCAYLTAFMIVFGIIPFPVSAADEYDVVQAGDRIETGGTYVLDANAANGTVTVDTNENVTIIGHGVDDTSNDYLTIDCIRPGTHLTIQNLRLDSATETYSNALRFTGEGNELILKGTNLLQQCYQNGPFCSVINVPGDAELTISGDGVLYMYKHAYAAAVIGGDEGQASGDIEIAGGTILVTTTMGGVAIGSDKEVGDITFSGGEVYLHSDYSAPVIGSSGRTYDGTVYMKGGAVLLESAKSYSVGYAENGKVVVTGGSFLDMSVKGMAAGTAMVNENGDPVYSCWISASPSGSPNGDFTVSVDGNLYYQGDGNTWDYLKTNYGVAKDFTKGTATGVSLCLTGETHALQINGVNKYAVWDEDTQTFSVITEEEYKAQMEEYDAQLEESRNHKEVSAYHNHGTMSVAVTGDQMMTVGDTLEVSVSPYLHLQYEGCTTGYCPDGCGDDDSCFKPGKGCICNSTPKLRTASVTVTSSDESVVTVGEIAPDGVIGDEIGSMADGTIQVTAVGEGTATITVEAYLYNWYPVTQKIQVAVASEGIDGDEKDPDQTKSDVISYSAYTDHYGTFDPDNDNTDTMVAYVTLNFDEPVEIVNEEALEAELSVLLGSMGYETVREFDVTGLSEDGKSLKLTVYIGYACYGGHLIIAPAGDAESLANLVAVSDGSQMKVKTDLIIPNGLYTSYTDVTVGTETEPASTTVRFLESEEGSTTRAMIHMITLLNGQPLGALDSYGSTSTGHWHNYSSLTTTEYVSMYAGTIQNKLPEGYTLSYSGDSITITAEQPVKGDIIEFHVFSYLNDGSADIDLTELEQAVSTAEAVDLSTVVYEDAIPEFQEALALAKVVFLYQDQEDGICYYSQYDVDFKTEVLNTSYQALFEEKQPDEDEEEKPPVEEPVKDGLSDTKAADGNWYYYTGNKVNYDYTGLAKNKNGWYYVENGKVNFSYTGFAKNSLGDWYVEKGGVKFNKNSVIKDAAGVLGAKGTWYYVVKNKVTYVDTVANNENGWWVIQNGKVNFSYTGFASNSKGDWYATGGKVRFTANSVIKDTNGSLGAKGTWYYVVKSKVIYTNTVAKNANGWWVIQNGKVNFGFTGIAKNGNGTWYIKAGKVQFGYSGTVKAGGKIYTVRNGKVA